MQHTVLLVPAEATVLWLYSGIKAFKCQNSNHHCGCYLDNDTSLFLVYLPTRSGCTDNFKESLDTLQVIKEKLDCSGIVISQET